MDLFDTVPPVLPDIATSWSALDAFETCGLEYYSTRILQSVGQGKGRAAFKGDSVHLAMQEYVENGKEPPLGLRKLKSIADQVCDGASDIVVEAKQGLRRDMSLCGYFDKDVAMRIIIDLLAVHRLAAFVVDWKSGTPRDKPDQLRINSWLVFSRYPQVQYVYAMYAYTKHENKGYVFKRSDWPSSVARILPRIQRLKDAVDTKQFTATPSWKCGFCNVLTCKHNNPRK